MSGGARRERRLADLGEHAWIRRLLRRLPPLGRGVLVGPGDDAAVLVPWRRPLVLTADALVEGTHFRHGWESPAALGRRAFRINVSDLAAMGARPRAALVAVEAPPALPVRMLDRLMGGLAADAHRLGAAVVGGNVAAGPHLAVTVLLLGEAGPRLLRRAGARPGDVLVLTGTIGGAGAAVRALEAGRRVARPPVPVRLDAARRLAGVASAAIDVSDGVLQDLGHLCRASGVAAELDARRLPLAVRCRRELGDEAVRFALSAGEDYELLAAVPPRAMPRLREIACRVTRVGLVLPGPPRVYVVEDGRRRTAHEVGFDHFTNRPRAAPGR